MKDLQFVLFSLLVLALVVPVFVLSCGDDDDDDDSSSEASAKEDDNDDDGDDDDDDDDGDAMGDCMDSPELDECRDRCGQERSDCVNLGCCESPIDVDDPCGVWGDDDDDKETASTNTELDEYCECVESCHDEAKECFADCYSQYPCE